MAFPPPPPLLYCDTSLGSLFLEEDEDHAIYDLDMSGRTLFTAFVTKDTQVSIKELQDICRKLQVLYPLDKISYQEGGVHLMALIYRPFKPLSLYLEENPSRASEISFVGVMRGILSGLNNIHKESCALFGQRFVVVVKKDDGQGSVVLLSNQRGNRENNEYSSDFEAVEKIISDRCLYPPHDLKTLLTCLPLGTTEERRRRFLFAPFFHTADEKINVYLVKIYKALCNCPEYKAKAQFTCYDNDVGPLVKGCSHKEVAKVWTDGEQNMIWNDYDLCRFIRNCVMHMDEAWRNKLKNNSTSTLVLQPEKFLQVIDSFSPNFLNTMFEHSYAQYHNSEENQMMDIPSIPILDNKY